MHRERFLQSFFQAVRRAGVDPFQLPENLFQLRIMTLRFRSISKHEWQPIVSQSNKRIGRVCKLCGYAVGGQP